MTDNTSSKVCEIIKNTLTECAAELGRTTDHLSDDDDFLQKGILDSFGYLDLIGALEDAFDLEIDIAELDEANMVKISGLTAIILELLDRK